MLSDFERKLLRILFNFSSQRKRMPTMTELERVTRKPAAAITQGLDGLVNQGYILWPNRPQMGAIVVLAVLEGERKVFLESRKARPRSGSIDYWTQY